MAKLTRIEKMRFTLAITSRPVWKPFNVEYPPTTAVLLDNAVLDIRAALSKAADWLRSKRKQYPDHYLCVFELDTGYVIANYRIVDL